MKIGRLAVNVLIDLHNLGLETKSTFDFINQTIQPEKAESKADGRDEEIIEISQTELIMKNFLKLRIPELK